MNSTTASSRPATVIVDARAYADADLLLGVDVGNSAISLALLHPDAAQTDGVRIDGELRLETQAQHDESALAARIRQFCLETAGRVPGRAVLCSVVPALTPLLTSTLLVLGARVHEVRAVLARDYGVSVDIPAPEKVGTDLIADCVAARELESAAIVDAGTATKVIALQRGTFMGVTISPGPRLLGTVLGTGTAQLPQIVPEKPTTVLGRDTVSAMRSGIYYQSLGGIRETLARVLQLLPDTTRTVLTGGYSHLLADEQLGFTLVDPYFLHRGLYRIALSAPADSWQSPTDESDAD